ncbi:DNA replication complex GINS protein PSF3-like [Anneissia japonica]|uniref:DNA replication complex GINS protein PSF3-like n=1 Tax=Anneissia japonica TaxID=1529436 RepID=UPI0014258F19|nr:DNA replication complex GINS protein PSF3-like [Anneissia japonica]
MNAQKRYIKHGSHTENYFNIHDILASQEKIPCVFEVPMLRLGFLDPSNESADIQPNTKMELPYWIASSLRTRKKKIVGIDLPKQYRRGHRDILSADANVVNLHKLGPYYYAFGSKLMNFDHVEADDIGKSLLQAFSGRFRKIMDSSLNCYNGDTTKLKSKLDENERMLFRAGQLSLHDYQKWEERSTDKIQASEMVSNHRKRKRAIMEQGTDS